MQWLTFASSIAQVIDEADRLLNQSFNDWLSTVLASIEVPPVEASEDEADQDEEQSGQVHDESGRHLVPDSVAPAFLSRSIRQARTDLDVKQLPSVGQNSWLRTRGDHG